MSSTARTRRERPARTPGLDWVLMLAVLGAGGASARCWSGRPPSHRDDLTGGDPTAYLRKQLVNIAIGLVLMVLVHRHRPPLGADPGAARLPRLGRSGWCWCSTMGTTINGSRSWLQLGGMSIQPVGVRQAGGGHRDGAAGRRAGRGSTASARSVAVDVGRRCSRSRRVPAALILLQPDLGTMLVLVATVFGVLAVVGRAAALARRCWPSAASRRRGRRSRPGC